MFKKCANCNNIAITSVDGISLCTKCYRAANSKPVTPDSYCLMYTTEDGGEREVEIEAFSEADARKTAHAMCAGNEGLWTGISLLDKDSIELEFNPF